MVRDVLDLDRNGSKGWEAGKVKWHRKWCIGISFHASDKMRIGSNWRVSAQGGRQEKECTHTYTTHTKARQQRQEGEEGGISAFTK